MLPHCLNMVRCHSNRRIDDMILVVNNIEFETLSSDSIVSNLRVAPYFCSRSDPQYDKRKSRSWHSDMKLVTKTPCLQDHNLEKFTGSNWILPQLHLFLQNKLSSISIICWGHPDCTGLFIKWGTVNYGMIALDLQFMLGIYQRHCLWLPSPSTDRHYR